LGLSLEEETFFAGQTAETKKKKKGAKMLRAPAKKKKKSKGRPEPNLVCCPYHGA